MSKNPTNRIIGIGILWILLSAVFFSSGCMYESATEQTYTITLYCPWGEITIVGLTFDQINECHPDDECYYVITPEN